MAACQKGWRLWMTNSWTNFKNCKVKPWAVLSIKSKELEPSDCLIATEGIRSVPTWYSADTFLSLRDCTKHGKMLEIPWLPTVQRKRVWVFGLSRTNAIFSFSGSWASCVQSWGDTERRGWKCSVCYELDSSTFGMPAISLSVITQQEIWRVGQDESRCAEI